MNLPEEGWPTHAPGFDEDHTHTPNQTALVDVDSKTCQHPMALPTFPIPAFNRGWRAWKMKIVWIKLPQCRCCCRTGARQDNLPTHTHNLVTFTAHVLLVPANSKSYKYLSNPVPKCPCLWRIYCHLLCIKHSHVLSHMLSHLSLKTYINLTHPYYKSEHWS